MLCWASSSSVWIVFIILFTAEVNGSAGSYSITVLPSWSSGASDNRHIIWKHQSESQCNLSIARTWRLKALLTCIAICNSTHHLVLYWWDSSNNSKLHVQYKSRLLLDGFALDVKVSRETRWIFHQLSSLSELVFRSLWMRFEFSTYNKLIRSKLVQYVISSMTLLDVSTTLGIVTSRIGSRYNVCKCGVPLRWSWMYL